MAYFPESDLKTLTLPSNAEYWVKVQGELRFGDMKKFMNVSQNGELDVAGSADLFLETVIKEWNLDDSAGAVLTITKENIDHLTKEDALYIIDQTGGAVEDDSAKKNS
jgi:hypothetical protein